MTDDEFKKAIIEAIHATPKGNTHDLLIRYRDSGGSQATAYRLCVEILSEIRAMGVPEDIDDALLDTMDGVIGDIAPSYRVWPDRLET